MIELGHVTDRKPPFKYSAFARVGFSDTDAQGVVYYGRYMPYFDLARTEFHRHLGRVHLGDVAQVRVLPAANEVKRENGVTVTLAFEGIPRIYLVQGYDSRLSQVINNLIDNARSFSPQDGVVRVICRRAGDEIGIEIDLAFKPIPTLFQDVWTILLGGVRGLFLRVRLWRIKKRHSVP